MGYIIREMRFEDWQQVKEIYRQGIETGISTFESEVPSWQEWDAAHIRSCRLVACRDGEILGWAALSPVSSRAVFSGVAEVSIYVGAEYRGQGFGKALLTKIIACSENEGYWTLQAEIFAENKASMELHKRCGFRVVGVREKIGRMKNGEWRDLTILERRSKKITAGMPLAKNLNRGFFVINDKE
ncbi:MAG: GNAT family N-acetyltransferase [Dethiobacteria bacterium]|nr:N-acetyltransferase [Bacillota bacterium]